MGKDMQEQQSPAEDLNLEQLIDETLTLPTPEEVYEPGRIMNGLVWVLKHTNSGERKELDHLPQPRRAIEKYLLNPGDYILRPAAGYLARAAVGGITGETMVKAAQYLESEVGIKEDPMTYTRYNLQTFYTIGFAQMALVTAGIVTLPSLLSFIPGSVAAAAAIINPSMWVIDAVRRAYLYKKGKPSGTLFFEAVGLARRSTKKYVIDPGKVVYDHTVRPALEAGYKAGKLVWDETRERVGDFWMENAIKLDVKYQNLMTKIGSGVSRAWEAVKSTTQNLYQKLPSKEETWSFLWGTEYQRPEPQPLGADHLSTLMDSTDDENDSV